MKKNLNRLSDIYNRFFLFCSKSPLVILVILICITSFFVFKDYFLFHKYFIFKDIGSDTYNSAYPMYMHYANYLRTDGIPRWSFNTGMGQNIFPGEITNPFTLLLAAFKPSYMAACMIYIEFLKILLTGILAYLWLRTIRISKTACIIGALCCSFCGFMIIGIEWYNFSSIFLFTVFFLYAFEKYLMQSKWQLIPVAVFFICPNIFSLYAIAIFFVFYIPLRYVEQYGKLNGKFFIFLSKLIGIGFIGLLLSFVLWYSALLSMLFSPRLSGNVGYFNALKKLPVFFIAEKIHYMTAILKLYSNDLLGTGNNFKGWYNYLEAPVFYTGLISLIAIPQLILFSKKIEKYLIIFILLFWFLIVLFPYFRHAINLFAGDYYKTSISIIISLLLLYLSIKYLNFLLNKSKINLLLLVFTLAGLIFLLFYNYFAQCQQLIDHNLRIIILILVSIYSVILYLFSKKNIKKYLIPVLLVLLCFELGYQAWISANKRTVITSVEYKSKTGYNDYTIDALRYIKLIDKGFYRINKDYLSGSAIHVSLNDAQIQDYYGTSSYLSFNNLAYIDFLGSTDVINQKNESSTRWSIGLITRPLLQTMASIKYNFSKPGGFDYSSLGYQQIGVFGDVTVFRNECFLPLGYTYDKYITRSQFKSLPPFVKDLTLLKAVLIEDKDVNLFKGLLPVNIIKDSIYQKKYAFAKYAQDIHYRQQGAMTITEFHQNLIKGNVNLDKRKIIFCSIPYDAGWIAKIDGNKVPILHANVGFIGVMCNSGKHFIELRYSPSNFFMTMIISISGLLLYLLFLFIKPLGRIFKIPE